MKNVLFQIAIVHLAISFILFDSIEAAPKKYSDCSNKSSISSPEGSSGYYMSADCKKAYVLPPQKGYVEYGNIISSLDASLCQGTQGLLNFITQSMNEIEQIRNEISKEELEAGSKDQTIKNLQDTCHRVSDAIFDIEDNLLTIRGQISVLEKEIVKLENEFIICENTNGEGSIICKLTEYDIIDLRERKSNMDSRWFQVISSKETNVARLELCEKRLQLRMVRATQNNKDYQKLKENLLLSMTQYQRLLNQQIEKEASEPGGVIGVNFLSASEDLRNDFIAENSHLKGKVDFVQIPLKSAKISFRLIENGKLAGFPVILQSHINGLSVDKNEETFVTTELAAKGSAEVNKLFGQGIGGNVVVNRLSVCKMARQKGLQNPSELSSSDIASLLKPTVYFDYELQVDRKIKVAYEESHFYQLIHKNTKSKSGLFETKTVNSLFERSEADKWISIDIVSEDGDHKFVDAIQMALDLKREFADAALAKVAKSYLSSEQVMLLEGGESAAQGASKEIKKCLHSYCQAAGIILDLGNALFGGSAQEANMTKIVSAKEKIEIKDAQMMSYSGSQVFDARGL